MNISLSSIAIFTTTCDASRDRFVHLADVDAELARLEAAPGTLPAVEFLRRKRCLEQYRATILEVWQREPLDSQGGKDVK